METTIHSEPSGMNQSKHRSVGGWLLAGGLLGFIGILLMNGAAWATHTSGQLCYGDPSDFHGTNASQTYDDPNNNFAQVIMGGGRDTVLAGNLDDKLCGSGDPDDLRGQADQDQINGGQGADQLFGAEDADTLNGGDGLNDYCDGGGGNDLFVDCECGPSNPC